MTGLDRLKAAFEAFAARQATPEQDTVVREAIAAGQVQVLSGERAIQFGRDANGATVVSGDRNLVISVAPGEIAALLKALATDRRKVDHLPADLGDFKGREKEIERLKAILTAGGGQAAVSAIGGMGGIGKSALAVHVAHLLADEAPDGRLFVDLGGRTGTPFAAVGAPQPGVPPVAGRGHGQGSRHCSSRSGRCPRRPTRPQAAYRAALDGKRVLLLLDNAENAAQVRPLLDWRAPTTMVVVTSRRTITAPGLVALRPRHDAAGRGAGAAADDPCTTHGGLTTSSTCSPLAAGVCRSRCALPALISREPARRASTPTSKRSPTRAAAASSAARGRREPRRLRRPRAQRAPPGRGAASTRRALAAARGLPGELRDRRRGRGVGRRRRRRIFRSRRAAPPQHGPLGRRRTTAGACTT